MNSPRMQRFGRILLVVFALACVLMTVAFAEGEEVQSKFFGTAWSLLPPVVAIVLALITKEVYSSLFIGIVVGFLLQADFDVVLTIDHLVNGFMGNIGGNAGILIFLVILGTMVALMIRAGGSKAYGDWAVKHIKTKSGALWSTFILAIVLGVDDYFNNLTTGNVMRPVADGHHISRAKLSYMCDATAAPVCIMMPVSSWAAAVTGVINNEELGFQIFLRAIPYNYYAVLTMVFIIMMTALNIDYGPMKKHEDNAAKGDLYTTPERPYADAAEMKFNPNGKVIDLVIPVVILIVCCVGGLLYAGWLGGGEGILDMFANTDAFFGLPFGATIALVINMIYFAVRRSMKFTELMDCLPEGFKQMVPAILILCMAWTISGVTRDGLGAPQFVAEFVEILGPGLHNFLPAVVFLIACFLGFATGTSWGTFGILLPIVLEIFTPGGFANLTAETLDEVPILMVGIGATLGGAVMGDHCSPISDTTIMASTGAQCYHLNHVATQMPYAVTVAAIGFVNYIITGLIIDYVPQVVCLLIAVASTVGFMLVVGKLNHSMNRHSQRD
ncbi:MULTISPECIES: Na+/H+ antiporter NhaC family protein [unclassified Flavonifractor]|uniref:Na+/H+ antiporter NhaC family protein n=1 Tax=unclassified Flavonifractor TaxID=2629267 RepID=UPI000B3A9FC0|nr:MULTISPECIES: Na+/H+ antiporter NhaC family protein [unclassified Flavonifractor]OUN10409.1 sodium:proton antiporter [Flavonifractor sp. An91]OUO12547.1 sodium:proton antiporter [Flavonifractor sp. An4]